jgi:translation initiation factor 5B
LGRVTSIQMNHKDVPEAKKGGSVAVKIEMEDPGAQSKVYGRHFDHNDEIVSKVDIPAE